MLVIVQWAIFPTDVDALEKGKPAMYEKPETLEIVTPENSAVRLIKLPDFV